MWSLCRCFVFGILFAGLFNSQAVLARSELSPGMSFYTGDAMRGGFLGNFSYAYHFSDLIWAGADFMGGLTGVDSGAGHAVRDSKKQVALNGAVYINLKGLLGGDMKDAIPIDLYTSLGFGGLWLDRESLPFAFLGGGMTIHYPYDWARVRFDLRNLFFILDNSAGADFNSDLVLSVGPSFLF